MLFHCLVFDTGSYSNLVVPFSYTIIGTTASLAYKGERMAAKSLRSLIASAPMFLVMTFNILFFTVKFLAIYITAEIRDPRYVNAFIKKHIPGGSRVIGDEMYYYAVRQASSDFQYMHMFKEDDERECYQREVYQYGYLLWSDKLQYTRPALLKVYQQKSRLVQVAAFHFKSQKEFPFIKKILALLHIPVDKSYNCILFKRIG